MFYHYFCIRLEYKNRMVNFYDISDWFEIPYINTKGTRNKCIVIEPNSRVEYYFKTSICKGAMDYKTEFWSEIIASKVGQALGFNVLDYNIAKHKEEIGCLSRSMINEGECLTEGISLLTGFDNTYHPSDKESYSLYTFQFIEEAISSFGLSENMDDIIRTIIFDALIGNSDRHQENWGFITPYQERVFTSEEAKSFLAKLKEHFRRIQDYARGGTNNEDTSSDKPVKIKILKIDGRYAPIYDSGCCLAREKSEDAVKLMLKDKIRFESFINRGQSEIRWEGNDKKLNHFELIKRIKENHSDVIVNTINQVIALYNENKIRNIVFNIDNALPTEFKDNERWALSNDRKELICRLIDERFKRLKIIVS